MTKSKKYKIGLVLGGGGARGFAHLGVYRALEEKGITPDIISGVSAGAIAGSFLADGKSADETYEILAKKSFFEYSKIGPFKSGLMHLSGLKEDLRYNISVSNIEDLKTPFHVCMTNINKGIAEYVNKGNLVNTVIASASIPILLTPMVINNQQYIDGGLVDNLPAKPIRDLCDIIIAVNISPIENDFSVNNMIDISARVFQISSNANAKENYNLCDIIIEPKELAQFNIIESDKSQEMFDIGYQIAKKTDFSLIK